MKAESILRFKQDIDLDKSGLKIWGYNTKKKFVCRLEINATHIEVFSGIKGGKMIADVNWEQLVEKLQH